MPEYYLESGPVLSDRENPISTPNPLSRFIWHDCLTLDIDQALDYLVPIAGWSVVDQTSPVVGRYPIVKSQAGPLAGILEMPKFLQANGAIPYWTGYVQTSLDVAQQRIQTLGGQLFTPPSPSTMGTSFVFGDSGGAVLSAFEPSTAFRVPSTTKAGEFCWQRLYSRDTEASAKFYGELFDWQTLDNPANPGGLQTLSGEPIGDIRPRPSWLETDTWVYFIGVQDLPAVSPELERRCGLVIDTTEIARRPAIITREPQGALIGFIEA